MDAAGFPASGKRDAVRKIDFLAVDQNVDEVRAGAVLDHDLESRAVAPNCGLETGPAAWDSRAEEQAVAAQPEAEDVFDDRSKHPAAGACVPGPAAASRIGRLGFCLAAGDIGFDAIALRLGTRARVVDG